MKLIFWYSGNSVETELVETAPPAQVYFVTWIFRMCVPPSNFIFPMFVIFSNRDQMSVFGTSPEEKYFHFHHHYTWDQFSGPIFFFEGRSKILFIFSQGKIDWSETTTINLCLYSHESWLITAVRASASSQQSRFIWPEPSLLQASLFCPPLS